MSSAPTASDVRKVIERAKNLETREYRIPKGFEGKLSEMYGTGKQDSQGRTICYFEGTTGFEGNSEIKTTGKHRKILRAEEELKRIYGEDLKQIN